MAYLPFLLTNMKPQVRPAMETLGIPGSSFLQAATYDFKSSSLTLDFKDGTQAVTQQFPAAAWEQFKQSPSKGSFYARSIKGKYDSSNFRSSLKVSDLESAMRKYRNANVKRRR